MLVTTKEEENFSFLSVLDFHVLPTRFEKCDESLANLKVERSLENEIHKLDPIQVKLTSTNPYPTKITPSSSCKNKNNRLLWITKLIILLTLVGLWLSYVFTISCVHFIDKYVAPLIDKSGQSLVHEDKLFEWENRNGGKTYILRQCEHEDVTTESQEEITFKDDDDSFGTTATSNFIELVMHHGAGIIPNLLQPDTTRELREVILHMNDIAPSNIQFDLKEQGNRYSLRLNPYDDINDPDKIIQKSLKEVATHKVLRETLVDVLGPDPALVELAAITSKPGAVEQGYHSDTWYDASHLSYARTHSALYSIFIYLQDTSVDMGVTGLCLGTHMCNSLRKVPCIYPSMPSGSGLIINSQLYHQGSGNSAYDKEDGTRVMYILTFASKPADNDPRILPLGSIYGIPWFVWGHTLDDFLTMEQNNWKSSALQAIGLRTMGRNTGISFLVGSVLCRAENFNNEENVEWFLERNYWVHTSKMLLISNGLALSFYLVLITAIAYFTNYKRITNDHTSVSFFKQNSTKFYFKPLMIFYLSSILSAFYFFQIFSRTNFVQRIRTKHTHPVPLFEPSSESELSPSYIESVTFPSKHDILFADHQLDSYYSYRNTFYYDYHPGNYEYRALLKEYAYDWVHHIPSSAKRSFIQNHVIDEFYSEFFLKLNDFGHWAIMNQKDIFNAARIDLYYIQYPIVRVLTKEIGFILSQCKYGDGGRTHLTDFANITTAMSKIHLPSFVNALKEQLLVSVPEIDMYRIASLPSVNKKNYFMIVSNRQPRMMALPTLSQNIWNRLRSHTTLLYPLDSANDESSLNTILPSNFKHKKPQNLIVQESTKYGVLQNITFGGYEAVTQMIQHMKNLPFEIVDKSLMDRTKYDKVLQILRDCKNTNEFCSHWASHGFCTDPEHMEYITVECRPSCQLCYIKEEK